MLVVAQCISVWSWNTLTSVWVMSCYGFKGSVSAGTGAHPWNVHMHSWAPIYFMARTWEVSFHTSALITGHKEKLKQDVELDCWWFIALHPVELCARGSFQHFDGKKERLGLVELPVCTGGISQETRVGGRGFPFSCVTDSVQATCFSLKYFFQAAKGDVFLSGTDHKLEVFVYIFFLWRNNTAGFFSNIKYFLVSKNQVY